MRRTRPNSGAAAAAAWTLTLAAASASAGDLEGTVTSYPDGVPLAGMAVYAFDPRTRYATAETGPDGVYTFAGLAAGPWKVRAWPEPEEGEDWVGAWYGDTYFLCSTPWIDVPDTGAATGVDIALPRGGSVVGRVVADEDGTPIEGAEVRFEGVDFYNDYQDIRVVTDGDGWFAVVGLDSAQDEPGDCRVRVEAEGRPTAWYPDALREADAGTAEAVRGETREIEVRVPAGGSASGAVSFASGEPAGGAWVEAEWLDEPGSTVQATAGDDGTFRIGGLAPGTWRLSARAAGTAPTSWPGTGVPAEAGTFEVALDADTGGLDVVLVDAGEVEVRVGAAGTPLAGAVVSAWRAEDGSHAGSAGADETGRAVLGSLAPGDVHLYVSAPSGVQAVSGWYLEGGDASPTASPTAVPVVAGSTSSAEVTLGNAARLAGLVVALESGEPVGAARVRLERVDGGSATALDVTGDDGLFGFDALVPGTYAVYAEVDYACPGDPGFTAAWLGGARSGDGAESWTGEAGGITADALLELPVDEDGDGMPGVWEDVWLLDPGDAADAALDADGDGVTNQAEYVAGTPPRDPAVQEESGGCSVTGSGRPARSVGWVAAAAVAAFLGRRRPTRGSSTLHPNSGAAPWT